ncbi:MAG: chromosome segregation protein SMC [Sphingomonadaceae bacterium]
MRFARLRLTGFKSFVEPAELVIRDGLTGVVGPNGCGKSNLLEAIRWVMGESSPKSLRVAAGGEGMDAVIFAGTARRPARDIAEVMLVLDNARGRAPPQFNDQEQLEVSRTIWRGEGSSYAINGREVRQKDVQLLFADAATGAHSPALVSQGRVAAIISSRPSERRLLLEEAAGISGLAARRKEAEVRLRAADANLLRLDDVMQASETQAASLRRQAKAAERYRELSAGIRSAEAGLLRHAWDHARRDLAAAEHALATADATLAEAIAAANRAATEQATESAALPARRQAETAATAVLQKRTTEQATLVAERAALTRRLADLEQALAAANADRERDQARARDSAATRARLTAERKAEEEKYARAQADVGPCVAAVEEAEIRATQTERAMATAVEAHAAMVADARAVRAQAAAANGRAERIAGEAARLRAERSKLDDAASAALAADIARAESDSEAALAAVADATAAIVSAERDLQASSRARDAVEKALAAARGEVQSLEAEAAALDRLQAGGRKESRMPSRVALTVTAGYEAAAAAALGEDIHAGVGAGDGRRWLGVEACFDDPVLPAEAQPLAARVEAPPELARRLAQVGFVEATPDAVLIARLNPGQRLVSKDGWMWRWDGFVAPPGGQAVAVAERLVQENRRREITAALDEPRARLTTAEAELAKLRAAVQDAQQTERQARTARTEAEHRRDQLAARLQGLHAAAAQQQARRAAMEASIERLAAEARGADAEAGLATAAVAALPDASAMAEQVGNARTAAERARADLASARAAAAATDRILSDAKARIAALSREMAAWDQRDAEAAAGGEILTERMARLRADHDSLLGAPEAHDARLAALAREITAAEAARMTAAEMVLAAELALGELDSRARAAQTRVADARESRATRRAHVDQARERMTAHRQDALDRFGTQPQMLQIPDDAAPDALERQLAAMMAERERLGIVNLRAAIELEELQTSLATRTQEREELVTAIARLRGSIGQLNREGRARLLQAFQTVEGHFRDLFVTLFEGGSAELHLVESEDPLDAGLEIRAQPPGKKLQSLSLLSGGEQALTACSLIFALFLTNPAPICVLDEVDAPLDDANVARFTRLLDHMATVTDTRFLIVTHNPVTMSRMHRLYGVTMGEPGVSQLVSVELAAATALAAA